MHIFLLESAQPHRSTNISSLAMQKETAQTFIDAYNAWDMDAIMGYRAPDCQHHVLPSSLGRPSKNNDEYRDYLKTIMPLFSNFTVAMSQAESTVKRLKL
jgi:ketosteroid isomerase-like protein